MTPPLRYRDEVRAKYPRQVAGCEALETFVVANRPGGPPTRDVVGDAILKTYAKSSKSFMASTLLAGHGYGEQAGMVNRSLFEDMLVAHWIRRTPRAAAKIERHRRLDVEKIREAAHRLCRQDLLDEWPPPMPRKEREELEAEFPGTRHWTGKSVDQLVRAMEDEWDDPISRRLLWQVYEFDHRVNNQFLHHGAPGLHAGIELRSGSRTFKTGPSWVHVKEALGSAFFSFSHTTSLVVIGETAEQLADLYTEHIQPFVQVVGLEPAEAAP